MDISINLFVPENQQEIIRKSNAGMPIEAPVPELNYSGPKGLNLTNNLNGGRHTMHITERIITK